MLLPLPYSRGSSKDDDARAEERRRLRVRPGAVVILTVEGKDIKGRPKDQYTTSKNNKEGISLSRRFLK